MQDLTTKFRQFTEQRELKDRKIKCWSCGEDRYVLGNNSTRQNERNIECWSWCKNGNIRNNCPERKIKEK